MACVTRKKSLGANNCNEWPSLPKAGIWTPNNFVIPAATAADSDLLKTFMQAALLVSTSARIYQFPEFDKITDVSEAKVRVQQSSGRTIPVREGLKRFDIEYSINICMHRAMYTHRTRTGRWIFIDSDNNYILNKRTDGDFQGYKISLLDTDSIKFNDGANPSISPVFLELADPNEINKDIYMAEAPFTNELDLIVDVNVTVVTITDAGDIDILVATDCDATGVSGLALADFEYLNAAGTPVTITARTESASVPGQYKLTQSGDLFVDGTVNIKTPSVLSIQAYESLGAATVNIP